MRTIDKAEAVALVMKYAEAEPDKVVVCQYVNFEDNEACTLKPECIIGHILINDLGVPADRLRRNTDRIGYSVCTELAEVGVELTPGALTIFDTAQSIQDGRKHFALRTVMPGVPMASEEAHGILKRYGHTWGDAGRFVTEFADTVWDLTR